MITTASSTLSSRRTEPARLWRACGGAILWLLTFCAAAQGLQVASAEIVAGDDEYYLNADFDIALGAAVESALNRGVPLTFIVEAQLTRPRWYWFDESVIETRSQYRLSYNALTQQYRVAIGTLFQNFSTLTEALQLLSRVRNRPMAEREALKKGETYEAAVRIRLDTSRLPKPFQVTALASREWSLNSDWYRWSFTP
jgi:hypothetical protein